MNVFELLGIIAINNKGANKSIDETSTKAKGMQKKMVDAFGKIEQKAVSMGKTVAKSMMVIATAGTAAVGALMKNAIGSYAEFEQLQGGIKKLFGEDSWEDVMANAKRAYAVAGISANEYMANAANFSATLIKDMEGDTAAATRMVDMAVLDMADNVNTFGTDMSLVQNAYMGFAKQNYTMLDNLKLGYGGTAEEMARLINDSGVMGEGFVATAENINDISFAKIIEAIHVVQSEMGIAGATADEVTDTITGSFNAWKAAGSNLLVAIASGDEKSISEAIAAFTTTTKTMLDNLKPAVEAVISSIGTLMAELLPDLAAQALDFGSEIIASIVNGITGSGITKEDVKAAINGILDIGESALKNTLSFITDALAWITENKELTITAIGAIALAFGIFKAKTDPIGFALDLIVAGLVLLVTNWESVKAAIDTAITAIDNFFSKTVPETWKAMVQTVADWWTGTAAPAIDSAATAIANFFGIKVPEGWSITDTIAEGWNALIETIAAAIEKVREFLGLADETGENQSEYVAHAQANAESTAYQRYAGRYAHWTWEQRSAAEDLAYAMATGDTSGRGEAIQELQELNISEEAINSLQTDISDALASGEFTVDNIYAMFEPATEANLQNQLDGMDLSVPVAATAGDDGTPDGSYASGLDFVPWDNYHANLHMGEMVLPRHEAEAYRSGGGSADNSRLEAIMQQVLGIMQQVAANTATGPSIVLDTGALVGQMAPRMDVYMGTQAARRGRG